MFNKIASFKIQLNTYFSITIQILGFVFIITQFFRILYIVENYFCIEKVWLLYTLRWCGFAREGVLSVALHNFFIMLHYLELLKAIGKYSQTYFSAGCGIVRNWLISGSSLNITYCPLFTCGLYKTFAKSFAKFIAK